MYKTNLCLFALILLGTFSCQQQVDVETEEIDTTQGEVDISAEEEAIKQLITRQDDAFNHRNLDEEAAVWAHEPYIYRGIPTDNIVGWDALRTYYEELFKEPFRPPYTGERSDYHIHIAANVAWAVYNQVDTWKNDQGEEQSVEFWQMRVLEKKAGQWKIVLQTGGAYPEEDE